MQNLKSGPEAHLNGLNRILYLEESTFRTEGVDTPVILAACQEHAKIFAGYLVQSERVR